MNRLIQFGRSIAVTLTMLLACFVQKAQAGNPAPRSAIASGAKPAHPVPAVSVDVHGKRVEFYEFQKGVLVMESGKAEGAGLFANAPQLQALLRANRLVDFFTAFRPDLPVPAALRDVQRRHPVITAARTGGKARSTGGAKKVASGVVTPFISCSNGCCDMTWLRNNLCPTSDNWFYYDVGSSSHDAWDISNWYSVVCAAKGTSQLYINEVTFGGGGTWSVPQGIYRWYSWSGFPLHSQQPLQLPA